VSQNCSSPRAPFPPRLRSFALRTLRLQPAEHHLNGEALVEICYFWRVALLWSSEFVLHPVYFCMASCRKKRGVFSRPSIGIRSGPLVLNGGGFANRNSVLHGCSVYSSRVRGVCLSTSNIKTFLPSVSNRLFARLGSSTLLLLLSMEKTAETFVCQCDRLDH
jgi:hypothetical protein